MSLSITNVVDVNILIAPKAKALQSFGKLVFVTDESPKVPLAGTLFSYSGIEAVADEWELTSEVYKGATTFYGQNPSGSFMVALAAAAGTPAVLTGGYPELADIQAITAGGFTIHVNGMTQNITNVDFSGASTLTEAAAILEGELTGVKVTVSGTGFVLTTKTIGTGASISVATADISDTAAALALTTLTGAVVTAAVVPESPVEALTKAADTDPSFYGIVLNKKWRDTAQAIDTAKYAQASRRVFFNTSNDPATLDKTREDSIAYKLKGMSIQRVLTHYSSKSDEYPSCAVAGRAFLVNFEGTNTTITLNLKVMKGVTFEKLRQTEHEAMQANNCNAIVDLAGAFVYSDSRMGDGTWFDAVHGVDWLQNRIETGIFNRMYTTPTKIPYTDTGVTIIIAEIEQALRQAVTNGLVAPGNTTSGEYLPLGYKIVYIPTAQVSQADKSNRVYKGITFEAVGAGAMHKVVVGGSFNE